MMSIGVVFMVDFRFGRLVPLRTSSPALAAEASGLSLCRHPPPAEEQRGAPSEGDEQGGGGLGDGFDRGRYVSRIGGHGTIEGCRTVAAAIIVSRNG